MFTWGHTINALLLCRCGRNLCPANVFLVFFDVHFLSAFALLARWASLWVSFFSPSDCARSWISKSWRVRQTMWELFLSGELNRFCSTRKAFCQIRSAQRMIHVAHDRPDPCLHPQCAPRSFLVREQHKILSFFRDKPANGSADFDKLAGTAWRFQTARTGAW
jgi:hypothetical protein